MRRALANSVLVLSLLRGAASEPLPCPVNAQSRYANYLNLFALAPDPSSFQTGIVKEESSAASLTSAVTKGAPTVVMFYAPWCPHCQSTKPVFDRVAQNFSSSIRFVQIDASGISEVRSPFGVTAYPTIKYFDGTPDALARAATYAWHGALEDDLRLFVVKQDQRQARPHRTHSLLHPVASTSSLPSLLSTRSIGHCSSTPPPPTPHPRRRSRRSTQLSSWRCSQRPRTPTRLQPRTRAKTATAPGSTGA